VPNFAEIMKPITNMLKKYVVIKSSLEEKTSFQMIKQDLVEAPVLASPDYTKDFFIFSFSLEETIDVVLLQKNEEGNEQSITFFSRALRDVELNYDILENKAYALVKALKSFRFYVLQSSITNTVSKKFWSIQTVREKEENGLSKCWSMTCT
jgi:hypothetical protein